MSRKNRNTRQDVLNAALELLQERAPTRMSDIARKAGISRQALYLHFTSRADLLIAAARHLDEIKDVDSRLAASRSATSGAERLAAYIDAWGRYIPEVYPVAKVLMTLSASDDEAAAAWQDRMRAMREGCAAAVAAIEADGALAPPFNADTATDWLWTHLSVENWERLTLDCHWPQSRYLAAMRLTAERNLLVKQG